MFQGIIDRVKRRWYMRSTESYIQYLRSQGMQIGDGLVTNHPKNVFIDLTRPWLIEIGNDVQIANGVKILTHGYDWSVIKGKYGDVLGSSGKVTIGNNVFIGSDTIILKGAQIQDNVIIGAGSVVHSGTIPSDSVAAGNPARVLMTLEDYRRKRMNAQKREARELVQEYYRIYHKLPDESVLAEFFWLFAERKPITNESFIQKMKCVNNYDYSFDKFLKTEPSFSDYKEFLNWCFDNCIPE